MQPPPTSSRSIFLRQTADAMPESRTASEAVRGLTLACKISRERKTSPFISVRVLVIQRPPPRK